MAQTTEQLINKITSQFSLTCPFNYFEQDKLFGDTINSANNQTLVYAKGYTLAENKLKSFLPNIKSVFNNYKEESTGRIIYDKYIKLDHNNLHGICLFGNNLANGTKAFSFKINAKDISQKEQITLAYLLCQTLHALELRIENNTATRKKNIKQKLVLTTSLNGSTEQANPATSTKEYNLFDNEWHSIVWSCCQFGPNTDTANTVYLDNELVMFKRQGESDQKIVNYRTTISLDEYVLFFGANTLAETIPEIFTSCNIKNIRTYDLDLSTGQRDFEDDLKTVKVINLINDIIIKQDGEVLTHAISEATNITDTKSNDTQIDYRDNINNSSLRFNKLIEVGNDESGLILEDQMLISSTETKIKSIKEY